jgi:SAM-dependent methyltransferase
LLWWPGRRLDARFNGAARHQGVEGIMVEKAQEIDVEQLLSRIRDDIARRESTADSSPSRGPSLDQVAAELVKLRSVSDVENVPLTSHRPLVGAVVVALKWLVRKLLTPSLRAQASFNATTLDLMAQTKDAIEALDRRHAQQLQVRDDRLQAYADMVSRIHVALKDDLATLRGDLATLRGDLAALRRGLESAAQEARDASRGLGDELGAQSRLLQTTRQSNAAADARIVAAERRLRRILHTLQGRLPSPPPPTAPVAEGDRAWPELEPEFDYAGFEDRFRGREEDIKDRQRVYLPYFEGRGTVLDLGCGRGEFLELLREHHVGGHGVDVDLDMILLCRDKGLEVTLQDGLGYLSALADDSVDGVFAGQLIEHMAPKQIVELVKACHRKLTPGGVLILETPNPQCLMIFADSFYRDLTHVRPIHGETMKFLLEATGFREVELTFSAPVDAAMRLPALAGDGAEAERFNRGIERLNSLLFGFQDYAVIGRKGPS